MRRSILPQLRRKIRPDHRCSCETIPDGDGWHRRADDLPHDTAQPEENITEDEYVESLGQLLGRAKRESAHRPFLDALDTCTWFLSNADAEHHTITWNGMVVFVGGLEEEQTFVYETYERAVGDAEDIR